MNNTLGRNKIIAVDFDGTLCEFEWPGIGAPKQKVIDYILMEQKKGAKLILWTNRTGRFLEHAIEWSNNQGIAFDAVNANLPEMVDRFHNDSRKVFADEYIDDHAVPIPGEGWNGEMTISELVWKAHENAVAHGFWDDQTCGVSSTKIATEIALIHSELSETLEEVRRGNPAIYHCCRCGEGEICCEDMVLNTTCDTRIQDPETPDTYCKAKDDEPEGYAVELADAVIRIADLCGALHIDLTAIIKEKMRYNATRPYRHGKLF